VPVADALEADSGFGVSGAGAFTVAVAAGGVEGPVAGLGAGGITNR